jgi:hypothetical protein
VQGREKKRKRTRGFQKRKQRCRRTNLRELISESEQAKVITECTAIYLSRVRKMQGLTRVDVTKKKKGGEVLVINILKAKRE